MTSTGITAAAANATTPAARHRVEIVTYRESRDDIDLLRVFIDGVEHPPNLWFDADCREDFDLSWLHNSSTEHAAQATPAAARAIREVPPNRREQRIRLPLTTAPPHPPHQGVEHR